jgi:hypothetical protein
VAVESSTLIELNRKGLIEKAGTVPLQIAPPN